MASGTNTSTSKIATIIVLIPILAALWYAAPWVLPVWRWQNLDFEVLARDYADKGYTKESLEKEFDFVLYYNPRGGRGSKDPCPFQIISMSPTWASVSRDNVDEHELLVRVSLADERDGEPVNKMWLGSVAEEGFVKVHGWRLPPGSCNKPKGRPVIVFKGLSLEKVELGQAINYLTLARRWENDDLWEDRDDGWRP